MSEDHERRISTVEANLGTISTSLAKIETYVGKLFEQTGDMKTGIALVVQNQQGMKDYQIKCDEDRADHDKRITSCEGFQNRLSKYALVITGIGSMASPQLSKLWERLFS